MATKKTTASPEESSGVPHSLPYVGMVTHYRLVQEDLDAVAARKRRIVALLGARHAIAAAPHVGDVLPLIVTSVLPDGYVNGHVILDGQDTLWVQNVKPV